MSLTKAYQIARAAYKAEKLRQKQHRAQTRAQLATAHLKHIKSQTNEAQNKVAALIMEMGAK